MSMIDWLFDVNVKYTLKQHTTMLSTIIYLYNIYGIYYLLIFKRTREIKALVIYALETPQPHVKLAAHRLAENLLSMLSCVQSFRRHTTASCSLLSVC